MGLTRRSARSQYTNSTQNMKAVQSGGPLREERLSTRTPSRSPSYRSEVAMKLRHAANDQATACNSKGCWLTSWTFNAPLSSRAAAAGSLRENRHQNKSPLASHARVYLLRLYAIEHGDRAVSLGIREGMPPRSNSCSAMPSPKYEEIGYKVQVLFW